MGRPSSYTDEVVEKVCEGIRLGLTYDLAAEYGGIGESTFYTWKKSFREFREAVTHASAHAAAVNMARINAAGQGGDWRASAWIMEHRFPEQYGRQIHEHQGSESQPLRVIFERVNRATTSGQASGVRRQDDEP